ncbi:MAG: thioesterase family protein [Gammaproteobacteria bacterium]|nr:thioesterase family protein [Gammaproteobacteria bacterium]
MEEFNKTSAAGGWKETHRAVVFPWHCDHLGHLNVRWYGHFFDDAGWHLWSRIGMSHVTFKERGVVTVVASIKTDFHHESGAGDLLLIESAFTRLGGKSLTMSQRMTNAETGVLCATQEVVEVFFGLETRKAAPMPDDIRAKLETVVIALD